MLSLPEHKRETFQPGVWASETNRRLAHHHGEKERSALRWFVPWMKSLQAEMFFFFFANFSFSSRAIMEFSWGKGSKASENIFGEEAVDAGDGKLMWSLRVASFHHCWNYLARTLILQISAALSWESLSLLDSSFRIMQRWEMGRLRVWGLCTHACGNVHACDRRCLLWLKLIAFGMQNTSAKTGIVIFIAC